MDVLLIDLSAVVINGRQRGTDCTSTDGVVHLVCAPRNKPRSRVPFKSLDVLQQHPDLVTPRRMQSKSGRNDANDAAAICEAASRPQMRFVPVKTLDQQGMLCVHRLREGFKEERTACINRIRGLQAEFGIVLPQSPAVLRSHLHDILEDCSNEIAGVAPLALQRALMNWQELDEHLYWREHRIAKHCKEDAQVQRAAAIKGLGPLTASTVVATVGDFKQFKNGAQFAAWLGLGPRQNSSGGKSRLGAITKRSDSYLRSLLVQ